MKMIFFRFSLVKKVYGTYYFENFCVPVIMIHSPHSWNQNFLQKSLCNFRVPRIVTRDKYVSDTN